MLTDAELLGSFVRDRSEDAFKTLLDRHLKLVYGAALRQVNDPGIAEDIAQGVFMALARKAPSLQGRAATLPVWLLTATRFAVYNTLRNRMVRAQYEQKAAVMKTQSATSTDSNVLRSIIDEALNRLTPPDRTAIAAYYLENRNLREVGDILTVSEDAAQKRVSRALDRLREVLARRGIVCPADALEASLHQYGAVAIPPMLLTAIFNGVFSHGGIPTAGSVIAQHILKRLLLKKVAIIALSTMAVAAVAAPVAPVVYRAALGNSSVIYPVRASTTVGSGTTVNSAAQPADSGNNDYQLGMQAFNKQDYQQAMVWFQKAAALDNSDAMDGIGVLYQDGLGVSHDSHQAMTWYQKGAEAGNINSMMHLAMMYDSGGKKTRDYERAFIWYQKAAALGNPQAMCELGFHYENGMGIPQDNQQAEYWYQKAIAIDHSTAMVSIGDIHAVAYGMSHNRNKQALEQAMVWYQKAAALDNYQAMINMGDIYQNLPAFDAEYDTAGAEQQTYQQAMVWYRKAAALGSARAMFSIGMLYQYGDGVPQDYTHAMVWYQKAAVLGDSNAMYSIGLFYYNGYGVVQDNAKAREWLEKASQSGNQFAQAKLASMPTK
ncbi:MAG TPA: sigma-70 family RNA polymerase sigma factor [Phycisphaerae bacterium]|nr:sigma-70 family RNA polymerase sigma factor [Phycisphaerae bacterium]